MQNKEFSIQLSEHDEKRFGVRTAHANNVTVKSLPEVIEFCRDNNVVFLVSRCRATEIDAVHAMEQEGFSLMDTLLHFSWKFGEAIRMSHLPQNQARVILSEEIEQVKALGAEVFKGYSGHYHMDDRLDNNKCDQLYPDRLYDSCMNRGDKSEVFVIEIEQEIIGFNCLIIDEDNIGIANLGGLKKEYRSQGLYWSFLLPITSWFAFKGVKEIVTATQVVNLRMIKYLSQRGYSQSHAVYTYHKWFD